MTINTRELIAAVDYTGALGTAGGLGFEEPHDMAWFRWYTKGKTIVAGRKTAESFGWSPTNMQPLPGRKLIVLSRTGGVTFDDVLKLDEPVCFIGGGEIYRMALPHVHRAVITHLECTIKNPDTRFDVPYLLKRFDKWITVKEWPGGRVTIYEHIRR